jgi:hypothetical protein
MTLQIIEQAQNVDLKLLVLAMFAVLEVAVRLTPSERDNSIVNKIVKFGTILIDILIPNKNKKGGRFNFFKR